MSRNWFADKLGTPQPQQQPQAVTPRPAQQQQQVSADGQWLWNGQQWVPNQPAEIPPPPPPGSMPRARHLKKSAGSCPQCGDDQEYFRPTTNSALRCFACGYIEGRDFEQTNSYDVARSGSGTPAAPLAHQAGGNWTGIPRSGEGLDRL